MKATKDNSVYISKLFKQEADGKDWISYQVKLTQKPPILNILSETTKEKLVTYSQVNIGEKLVLVLEDNSTIEFTVENVNEKEGKYEIDLSSLNLQSNIKKVYKNPANVYVCFEDNEARCLFEDLDLSDKIVNSTKNSFELTCDKEDLLKKYDEIICNNKKVKISNLDCSKNIFVQIKEHNSYLLSIIPYNNHLYVCGYYGFIAKLDEDLNIKKQIRIKEHNSYLYSIIPYNNHLYVCGYPGLILKLDENLTFYKTEFKLGDKTFNVINPNYSIYNPNYSIYNPNYSIYNPNFSIYNPNFSIYNPNYKYYKDANVRYIATVDTTFNTNIKSVIIPSKAKKQEAIFYHFKDNDYLYTEFKRQVKQEGARCIKFKYVGKKDTEILDTKITLCTYI